MNETKAKEIVQKMVNEWSKVYINQVFFLQKQEGEIYTFKVEFSKPKNIAPIPAGTVFVYFMVYEENDETVVEFNFENESLRHKAGFTMRSNMYESWINNTLEKKLKVKTELHLGTEFEFTRFVDDKGRAVDPFVPAFDIMKVKNLQQQKKES